MTRPTPPRYLQRDRRWHPPAYAPGYKTSVPRSPRQALVSLQNPTATELTGPSFERMTLGPHDNDLLMNFRQGTEHDGLPVGERIMVFGRVLDQFGKPVPQTLVEMWQANAGGRYRHKKDQYLAPLDPNFGGVGRTITDEQGWYRFRTVRPGPYPWPNDVNSWRPAHIHMSVMGPALSSRLITQLYFEGDPLIPHCPIVHTLNDPDAVRTLTAKLDLARSRPMDALAYRFDIVTRGQFQTYFENQG
ncbi:protocatechuate 3,4-dioxygenase subunit beta [Larsenimonas suaedae]|uniref:Protocatechuate 3,4-dioxygenase subunit beta n=1 Tax=Larsenimonas suaedae TaxID=1851019 RepID=A0ABU1GZZ1_9GAMM|nr:protocatechuate 3,4-dioxygenase subunit beta [Larsenimonas suaedae]MCM2973553.1 protocatechuate 3,4-dioxygenase subunit beta [Larsenimonas suaedae]MDR5897077.1 protocatechuate 3,4-dioxygenase subunit beta [Larsenimonas suaedae]